VFIQCIRLKWQCDRLTRNKVTVDRSSCDLECRSRLWSCAEISDHVVGIDSHKIEHFIINTVLDKFPSQIQMLLVTLLDYIVWGLPGELFWNISLKRIFFESCSNLHNFFTYSSITSTITSNPQRREIVLGETREVKYVYLYTLQVDYE
jgi:hypothetical protein